MPCILVTSILVPRMIAVRLRCAAIAAMRATTIARVLARRSVIAT